MGSKGVSNMKQFLRHKIDWFARLFFLLVGLFVFQSNVSAITGGNFWDGAKQGATSGAVSGAGYGVLKGHQQAKKVEVVEEVKIQKHHSDAARGSSKVLNASKQASKWLGKDFKTITNKAGDKIFMSKDGLKKMRLDIKNPHGNVPHIHLEIFKNGKWRDAIPGTHRIYPKQ